MIVLGFSAPAPAQLDTGSISGTVTDQAGKVVPGAPVTATDKATGSTYSTIASGTGFYSFPSVRTGTYEIKVSVTGFKNAVYSGVTVAVGSSSAQDVVLAVGSASEVVSVIGGQVTLEKETSEVDANIAPEQVADLPLQVSGNLRSLSTLEFLVPGAVGPGTSSGGSGFQMTKINGGQEEGTDYLVDGITTNRMENGSGSFDIVAPSVEAVNEFLDLVGAKLVQDHSRITVAGQGADAFYLIVSGRARAEDADQAWDLGAGDVVGEETLDETGRYGVSVMAMTEMRLMVLSGGELRRLTRKFPLLAQRIKRWKGGGNMAGGSSFDLGRTSIDRLGSRDPGPGERS